MRGILFPGRLRGIEWGNPGLRNPLPMIRVGDVNDYEFSRFSSDGECEKVPLAVVCSAENLFIRRIEVLHCSVSKERFGVHGLLVVPYHEPLVVTDPESVEDSTNRSGNLF